jgi:hypothetical protein
MTLVFFRLSSTGKVAASLFGVFGVKLRGVGKHK